MKYHVVGSKVEVHPTFDTAFYEIVNAIGDICKRTRSHKVLFFCGQYLSVI